LEPESGTASFYHKWKRAYGNIVAATKVAPVGPSAKLFVITWLDLYDKSNRRQKPQISVGGFGRRPHRSDFSRGKLVLGFLFLGLLLLSGCARTPAGAISKLDRQLLVQLTVRGQINPQRHYFFAIDTSNDTSQGPIPTVAPPWGNGWGAGRITYYVQVDAAQPGFFGFYRFEPNSNLLAPTYLGRPLSSSTIENTSSLSFSLNLDNLLDPNGSPAQNLNLNFINTDRIPLDPNDREPKLVDALGRVGNNYISINTQQQRIYQNSQSSEPEVSGDVADPDLDIVDWQIEVRRR
jgi:hypothetical protein